MHRRHALFAACTIALAAAAQAAPAVGSAAPDFTLQDTSGKPVKLSDFKGRHVVLEWTNPGCPYVRKHYDSGNMPTTMRDATGRGVVWLSVNSTETGSADYLPPQKLAAWLGERKARPNAILMDEEGSVGKAYGARTTPHMYIVDPKGRLVYAGGIDSIASANPDDIPKATNFVKAALDEALAGRPVSQPTTRAYGCSIKYKG